MTQFSLSKTHLPDGHLNPRSALKRVLREKRDLKTYRNQADCLGENHESAQGRHEILRLPECAALPKLNQVSAERWITSLAAQDYKGLGTSS